jgi:hypothetical protein
MPVMAVHQVPSLTQERYEEVVRRLTDGKSRLESLSDSPFEGLLVHVAAQSENGFLIFDVLESEEAFGRFSEAVRPIAQEVGIEDPPKAYQAHTFVSGWSPRPGRYRVGRGSRRKRFRIGPRAAA